MTDSHAVEQALLRMSDRLPNLASPSSEDYLVPTGYDLRRFRAAEHLNGFSREWTERFAEHPCGGDFLGSEQAKECLQELLDFLDADSPDTLRFSTLKSILFTAAKQRLSNSESVLPQQYMRICRGLTAGETLVLLTTFSIVESGQIPRDHHSTIEWVQTVGRRSGLIHPELVELHEHGLIAKRLITARIYHDGSKIAPGEHYRLTDLAYDICRFIAASPDPALASRLHR